MNEIGVRTRHPDYIKREKQWKTMRDVIEGSDAVKAADDEYLPRPVNALKQYDSYEEMQYQAFKNRAPFVDFTAQIKDCLHGMIEAKPAEIVTSNEMRGSSILENIDYKGNSADQFFSDCLNDVLVTGRGGILVDLPAVNPGMSVKQAEDMNIRPYLSYYNAESIINWKYKIINGVKTLSLVVLEEEVDEGEDIFDHKKEKQFRVYMLNNKNECVYSVYRLAKDQTNGNTAEYLYKQPTPIVIQDHTINYIPFILMPFNDPVKPILYDIALVNIHHYQVSADYQNGAHLTSKPTVWFTGHKPELDKNGDPIPVMMGSDIIWQLEEPEAKVGVCSMSGEGIQHLEAAQSRAEAQIITLASHIISQEKKTAENKDAITIHRAGEDAKIATYARYLSKRYTDALKIMEEWSGWDNSNTVVNLNTDFSNLSFDANAVNSIANIFSQGKLPLRCLYYLLHSSGYLEPDMSYEGFVYLLDLEASSLAPTEVDIAYREYKRNGKKIEVEHKDWYSPESSYEVKDEADSTNDSDVAKEDE